MALAQTEAELGKKNEAREYASRALKAGPGYKDQIEGFLKDLEVKK